MTDSHSFFVSPHPESSQTKANKTACVQARVHILELVGASEPAFPNSTGSLDGRRLMLLPTDRWNTQTVATCQRKMEELGVPEATLGSMLALLTDSQSNIRPSIMNVDVDLLECCVDVLHDMGYPDAAGALGIPATWPPSTNSPGGP